MGMRNFFHNKKNVRAGWRGGWVVNSLRVANFWLM